MQATDEYVSFSTYIEDDKYKILYYCNENENCNNIKYGNIYSTTNYKVAEIENKYNNPSSFNSKKYYGSQNIFYKIIVQDYYLDSYNSSLLNTLNNYRRNLSIRNQKRYPNCYQIINALILGYNDFDEQITNDINNTGVNHLFVISGTHLMVIIYILNTVLGYFQLNSRYSFVVNIVLLIIYSILVGFSYPIIRATFTHIISKCIKKTSKLQANLIIFFILILNNPLCIYNLSFFLSFYISFIIIPINFLVLRLNKSPFISNIIFSYLIYLSIIPIVINMNYTINIFSPVAGIVLGFIVSFVLIPLGLFLTFSTYSFGMNYILCFFYNIVLFLLKQFSFYTLHVGHINEFYQILLIILLMLYVKTMSNKYVILYISFISLLLINLNILGSLTIIDIGQGDSTLIQFPFNGEVVLIDTGPIHAQNELDNYLRYMGIRKIDKLIITHDHADHNANVQFLLDNYKIKQIYSSTKNPNYETTILKKGDKIIMNKQIIEILSPSIIDDNQNLNSISFIIELGEKKWFFGGDIENKNEQEISSSMPPIDIDYFKVSHHGSNTSSSEQFIDQFTPEYAIISCGKNNMYNHPSSTTIESFNKHNIKTFVTKDSGAYIDYFVGDFYFGGI